MEQQSPWRLSIVTDLLAGVWNFIVIFFKTMTTPKDRIPAIYQRRARTTYAERQGVRRPNNGSDNGNGQGGGGGANIRGMKNLGTAQAPCGGGG
jgi:hypothetical protein